MIGSSRLTSLYIQLLQAHTSAQREVVAVLDDKPKLFGRTICGVPVVGALDQLDSVIEEFAVHGIRTDRVILGGDESLLSAAALTKGLPSTVAHHRDWRQTSNQQNELALHLIERTEVPTC
jgi:FlaA1/EpsC-like NDP-sugar epimerase